MELRSTVMFPCRTSTAWLAVLHESDWDCRLLVMVVIMLVTVVICPLIPFWLFKATLSCWVRASPLALAVLIYPFTLLIYSLRLFSWVEAPEMADCMFCSLPSSWLMVREMFCWLVTAELREEVKLFTSFWAFCLLAEACLMISSRLAIVWLTCVCWLNKSVILRSYWERLLMAWFPRADCSVAIWMTWVFGTELGRLPVTTTVGYELMVCEVVLMKELVFWLY